MTGNGTTIAGLRGFPGFGEDAPLDLPGPSTPAADAALVARLYDGTFDAWAEVAARVGYCAHPVRLVGSSLTVDSTTGEVVGEFASADTPLGVLHRPCGNRRVNVCPSCSRTYARDTYQLIRAGLVGGKTIPAGVADNPLLFVTLTAPSFGHVHGSRPTAGHPTGGRCRPHARGTCGHGRPNACHRVHGPDDPANGAPVCADCYDWASAVVWQWHANELWRRTTITLRRRLAAALGVTERDLSTVARVEYAKVAEYQARGAVHYHALIRLDEPDGPGSPAPLDGDQLRRVVTAAIRDSTLTAPPVDGDDVARVLAWGRQLDVRVVRTGHRTDDPTTALAPEQVAGYLAKYATKDAGSLHGPGDPRPHLVRLKQTCRHLHARSRTGDAAEVYRLREVGAHARVPRPLLHQVPPLLDHPRPAPPRPPPLPAAHRRRPPRRPAGRPPRPRRPAPRRRRGNHPRPRVLDLPGQRLDPARRRNPRPRRRGPRPRARPVASTPTTFGVMEARAREEKQVAETKAPEDRLWTVHDVAGYLGVAPQTLYAWRSAGTGPPGRIVGSRLRYRPADVRAWVESLPTLEGLL